jgi:hypothetical protein
LYNELVILLTIISDNTVSCSTTQGGYCQLQSGDCASYQTALSGYSFKVQFPESVNYMRIPLMTFAVDSTDGTACNIITQILNNTSNSNVGTDKVIFGGMFFQEFYSQFTNHYNTVDIDTISHYSTS